MNDDRQYQEYNAEDDEHLMLVAISPIIGNLTIEDRLSLFIHDLNLYTEEEYGESDAQKVIDTILQEILSNETNKSTVAMLHYEFLFSKDLEAKKRKLIQLTLIYTAAAQSALKNGSTLKSWQAIAEAKHYLAYYAGLNDPVERKKVERAQKGGNQKAKNTETLKQAIIMLLKEKRPKKGRWRSPQDAAIAIVDDFKAIAEKEGISIPSDKNDLIYMITNPIHEDKDINKAFA